MIRKTAAVLTLGCRLNQADSALIHSRLQRMGFEIVAADASPGPSLIIVNSCAVTATALKKSLQMLRSVRAENPQAYIVFTGCAAVTDKDSLENRSDIDLLLSNEEKKELEKILPRYLSYLDMPETEIRKPEAGEKTFFESAETVFPFKTRATLKVQEGCSNACSYCIVPRARGPERARDFDETLADFRSLVDKGFREIVLSGINLCTYRSNGKNLADLMEACLEVPGDWRLRLGSAEPGPIMLRLLEVMADSQGKICQFLHMPLQHGSDTILRAMNRHCFTGEYADYVQEARRMMPQIHVGTDIIAGFPGETEELFQESCDFLQKTGFSNIHAFTFSSRPGTPAAKMKNDITKEQLADRLSRMKELKAALAARYAKTQVGKEEQILVELNCGKNLWEGWSGNYLKTVISSPEDMTGKLLKVRFHGILPKCGNMEAEIL